MYRILTKLSIFGGIGMMALGWWFQPRQPLLAQTSPVIGQTAISASQSLIGPAQANITITVNEIVASGLSMPVQVTHAGDGSGRLFVVEQTGAIKIIKNGAVLGTPFLNLSSLVSCCGERGLLGLAFHPNYKNNGYFYVNYTRASDGATVIARYSVSNNPDQANAGSAFILLTIAQPYSNHNGGQVMFGPDGYLYIGMGDGGSGGDPQNNAQNTGVLLGKLLRLDVNSGSPYGIPPTNPYVGPGNPLDEIWALGLRNPWRFSFDRLTGDLYIGDVGQNAWEEIDFQPGSSGGGLNFGWRCREGAHNYDFSGNCGSLSLTEPIAEYSHSEGNAVTGGYVYRGNLYPALWGRYFFADYGAGKIWSIYKTGATTWSTRELELDTNFLISSFGEDENGELYVVEYSSTNGKIRHLADANSPNPNLTTSTKHASTPYANPGEVLTYTLQLNNTGGLANQTAFLTDTLPAGLDYVSGSLTATLGSVDDSLNPMLHWQGLLAPSHVITITYRVTATGAVSGSLINTARVSVAGLAPFTLTETVHVPRPVLSTTVNDFFFPGTQPGQLTVAIPDPGQCDTCHTAPIYDRWRGSMMSQAGRDPVMWAALSVANNFAPNAGEYCLRCHAPKGWLEGRSQPATGAGLNLTDIDAGVACEVCHRLVDPLPSNDDEAVLIDDPIRAALTSTLPAAHTGNAMMIVDPADNRRGPFTLSPPHTALRTDFLGQNANAVTEARLCGTCHNVDNPVLSWDDVRQQYWPNQADLAAPAFDKGQLFPIERTFDEWLNSEYAATGVFAPQFAGSKADGIVRTCHDCHMRRATGLAAEAQYNPVARDCVSTGCLPEHDLAGGNTWTPQLLQDMRWRLHSADQAAYLNTTVGRAREMLQKAATLTMTLTDNGVNKIATIRVINQTGHKLPTGYPEGRRMWLNIKAYDANNNLLYESGAYNPLTGQLTEDADIQLYEVKQGLTSELAALLKLPAGASFHFVLNNTMLKDNRIPPRGYTQAAFDQPGLRPIGAVYTDGQYWADAEYTLPLDTARVTAILYYQTASKEYIDFLRANGGVDGSTLGALWDTSKSPPEVMAVAFIPSYPTYLPIIFKH